MEDSAALVRFYDDAYSRAPAEAARSARWRALGAIGKADHVIALCTRAGLCEGGQPVDEQSTGGQPASGQPFNTLEVGCGDGALLCELHRRGFGGVLSGVEITQAAVDIARQHPEIDSVELYDGLHLRASDGAYELGVVSHVLEHVHDPAELLAEVARACRAVVVEVPLEANWSARRGVKREHAAEVGHLQRLDRDAVRAFVTRAGLSIAVELDDPLPLEVHRFFASSQRARAAGTLKWAARAGVHRLAPSLAHRTFTLHYACLCLPADG